MNKPFNIVKEKNYAEFYYKEVDIKKIENQIMNLFLSKEYKLEEGNYDNGIYGKGNQLLRILFGAFAKRYVFEVNITQDSDITLLKIEKGISGAMGGFIGYRAMNKEFKKIIELIS